MCLSAPEFSGDKLAVKAVSSHNIQIYQQVLYNDKNHMSFAVPTGTSQSL